MIKYAEDWLKRSLERIYPSVRRSLKIFTVIVVVGWNTYPAPASETLQQQGAGRHISGATFLAQADSTLKSQADRGESVRQGLARSPDGASDSVWRSEELDLLGIGLAIGDLDGDGRNDVVIIDPSTVYVYSFSEGRLTKVAEHSSRNLELKSVDVARSRPGAPPRIYVTAQNRGSVASFVLEFTNGILTPVIKDFPYYLRVLLYPTRGPILLGQQKGLNKVYEGPIVQLVDQGSRLEVQGRFGVPLKIPIFGFAIGDLEGKRRPLIAVYDKEDHLRVYEPSGKRLFISNDYYGGSDVLLRLEGPTERSTASDDNSHAYYRPRIMSLDLDGDAAYEVIALTHSSRTARYMSRTKMLEDGQVISLKWNGETLIPVWCTPPIQGMITDFTVDNLPGLSGRRLIVLERKKTDWLSFLRSKSQIKAYALDLLMADGMKYQRRKE